MKTLITNALIQSLNPCKDRLDNYLKFYASKSHTKAQFMGLKNITHQDKIWVAFRLMSNKNVSLAAADIAESVLYLWEREYPEDLRPRKAIEAARSGVDCDSASSSASVAAESTTSATSSSASADAAALSALATLSANAAAIAAEATADLAALAVFHAVDTAAYAAASSDTGGRKTQKKLIRKIILKYWR